MLNVTNLLRNNPDNVHLQRLRGCSEVLTLDEWIAFLDGIKRREGVTSLENVASQLQNLQTASAVRSVMSAIPTLKFHSLHTRSAEQSSHFGNHRTGPTHTDTTHTDTTHRSTDNTSTYGDNQSDIDSTYRQGTLNAAREIRVTTGSVSARAGSVSARAALLSNEEVIKRRVMSN